MDPRLAVAAQSGYINALYQLLRLNPILLDEFDEPSFADTPLHTAACAGSTLFAIELVRLKPSFVKKPNPDGYTPLDLALRAGKIQTVKRLIALDPELIRVKSREGFTPLHSAAEADHADLLAEFLQASPSSIGDLTIRGETAVHVAVRNRNVRALQVLLGWLRMTWNESILNWKDENEDTVMHVAVSTNNFEVVELLINNKVRINEKNLNGFTALDTFLGLAIPRDERITNALRRAGAKRSSSLHSVSTSTAADKIRWSNGSTFIQKFFRPMFCFDGLSTDTRNVMLVVAILIATVAYHAVLSPPGGISSGGKVQMREDDFYGFVFFNTIAFAASLVVIFCFIPNTGHSLLLFISLIALLFSYTNSVINISPNPDSSQMRTFFSVMTQFTSMVLSARMLYAIDKIFGSK